MNLTTWTDTDRLTLWSLVCAQYKADQQQYDSVWLPYMAGFKHHFEVPLLSIKSLDEFDDVRRHVPWACVDLNLTRQAFKADDMARLAKDVRLMAVRGLDLSYNEFGVEGLRHMADSDFVKHITELNLWGTALHGESIQPLAHGGFSSIRGLSLRALHLHDEDVRVLAQSEALNTLETLDLAFTRPYHKPEISPKGIACILDNLPALSSLDLTSNWFGDELCQMLATRQKLPSTLHLGKNDLSADGIQALVQSECCTSLRALSLHYNPNMTEVGLGAVGQSPHLCGLKRLNLSENHMGHAALSTFASTTLLNQLSWFDFSDNKCHGKGIKAFVKAAPFDALNTLMLSRTSMGDGGFGALVLSPMLANVEHLDVTDNKIGKKGITALAQSTHASNLRVLNVKHNNLEPSDLAVLFDSPNINQTINILR